MTEQENWKTRSQSRGLVDDKKSQSMDGVVGPGQQQRSRVS